jgi:hypothetical protein
MITGIATDGCDSPARGSGQFGKITAYFEASTFGTTTPREHQIAYLVVDVWANLMAPFPPLALRPRAVESALEEAGGRF